MPERTIGSALQFALEDAELPKLLRTVAESIESLGSGAEILDVVVRADTGRADVYFVRVD